MTLLLRHTAIFIIYLLAQLLVFNHLTLWDIATAHVFLVSLLIIPVNAPFALLLVIGFTTGMLVDVFSVGAFKGISAFSCVLMLSLRNPLVGLITNKVSFRGSEETLIRVQPFTWLIQYLLPLIVVYELSFHFLEAFSFQNIGVTLLKVGTSIVFTFTLCFIFTYWIHQDSKR
jgi:hypothetical protein